MLPPLLKTDFNICITFILSSANAFNWDESASLSSGKGFNHTILTFNNPKEVGSERTAEKRDNAGYQHFLLFPQSLLSYQGEKSSF